MANKSTKDIMDCLKKKGICATTLEDKEFSSVGCIPSGSIGLDYALGIGGYPRGRIIEIFGMPTGGKSTMAFLAIREVQKQGGSAALIDAEYGADKKWLTTLGVDVKELLLPAEPEDKHVVSGEEYLQNVEHFVNAGVDLVVVDSVAALVPQVQLVNDIGVKEAIAVHARMMSSALRRLSAVIGSSKTTVIFINQLRSNPGIMFGNPDTTTGGQALQFYSSVRLQVTRSASKDNVYLDAAQNIIGHKMKIKVVKNKVGEAYRTCEFDFYYKTGIDTSSELLDCALEKKLIQRPNNITYVYKDISYKGRAGIEQALKADIKLQEGLKKEIKDAFKKN